MELRRRLRSVGIRTIFCWGDKESERFWFKPGFVSIAEVGVKGKARRIPIRSDIRRALCFPGGFTLMVSHIYQGIATTSVDLPNQRFSLKIDDEPSSYALARGTGVFKQSFEDSNAVDQQNFEKTNYKPLRSLLLSNLQEDKIRFVILKTRMQCMDAMARFHLQK